MQPRLIQTAQLTHRLILWANFQYIAFSETMRNFHLFLKLGLVKTAWPFNLINQNKRNRKTQPSRFRPSKPHGPRCSAGNSRHLTYMHLYFENACLAGQNLK